jgi:hypothetical protein
MLLTAFILAVGIMGLTLLQVMSLKGAQGSRSLSTAVQVGEAVMDRVEMEGRLTWLNQTNSQYNAPSALTTLQFVNQGPLAAPLTFNIKGQTPDPNSTDPAVKTPYFSVNVAQADVANAGTGKITDVTVTVTFSDVANPTTNLPITRTVTFTRRVLHG